MLGLVAWVARKVEWAQVGSAVLQLPLPVLLGALALAALSHAVYGGYDLLARAWLGHRLPWYRVLQVTFVSYAFNLNLGSMVGAIAMRLRLYGRLGLENAQIGQILGLALATNWLGYGVLAGGVFLFRLLTPPADWTVSALALQGVGALLWLLVAAYLVMCAARHDRPFALRGHVITLPTLRIALAQIAVSCTNWLLIAAIVTLLLQGTVPYTQVLPVYLLAVVAGLIVRVPGGLGVLEAVFVAMLAPPLGQHTLLAALLAYRALYYLLPLAVAAGLYFMLEGQAARRTAEPSAVPSG